MGNVIHDVYGGHNEMGNRPISYQDCLLYTSDAADE